MFVAFVSTALAQVSMEAVTRVQVGESPRILLKSQGEGSLRGQLECEGGRALPIASAVHPGSVVELPIPGLGEGVHACRGLVRLDTPDGGTAEMPLSFSVELRPPLSFRVEGSDWDRERKTLVLHPSRPLRAATADVVGVGGVVLESGTAMLADPSAPTFAFSTPDEILQLRVTAEDDAGLRASLELSPWYYAIPHEDVVFASGSAAIPPGEVGKLNRCWTDVAAVLDKYGSVVKIRLYVAGYTDTVGPAASNQALSVGRARSIAAWFVQRGFPGEVWYQGFGESVLAVPTPDETDAAGNRRALYLLAAEVPPVGRDLPAADWVRAR